MLPGEKSRSRGKIKWFKDKFDQDRLIPYLRARAQAAYRKERWSLTLEQWMELWSDPDVWYNRGKRSDQYGMTRINPYGSWSKNNIVIMTRREQIARSLNIRWAERHGRDIREVL